MSMTLPFYDRLLDHARRYQDLGLNHRATTILERLADFRELPADVVEETQHRLAQLSGDAERHCRSRRHLAVAITHGPTNAECRADMGRAIERDPACADEDAYDHYGQATQLDPENPRYLCDYGSLAIRLGECEAGLNLLRQAREIAPDDMDTLASYVTGLVDAGQPDEARCVLRDEAFRHAGDRRFQTRYRSLRFKLAHDEQNAVPMEEPCMLPFRRPETATRHETEDGRIVRLDAAEGHAGPRRQTPDVSRNEQSQRE
jgi:tetratricopeptide (TPR) repeat protein